MKVQLSRILAVITLSGVLVLVPLAALADPFQRQIEELSSEIEQNQATLSELDRQRDTLENRLAQLRTQINSVETSIRKTQAEIEQIQLQLAETEEQLAIKKKILAQSVIELYKRGDVSTLEVLASSSNFSDFINRQEYMQRIKVSIQEASRAIVALKEQLEAKESEQSRLLLTQQAQQSQLEARRSEQQQLLEITRGEEQRYQAIVAQNQQELENLMEAQRQYILERQRQGRRVDISSSYPWANECNDANGNFHGNQNDSNCGADDWGFYYRQCTSYAAWRRAQLGRPLDADWGHIYFPADAKYWKEIAESRGYKVNRTPAVGAIAVYTSGHFGHVAIVEALNSNGTIDISQYNAAFEGEFSYMSGVSANQSDLWFIHD